MQHTNEFMIHERVTKFNNNIYNYISTTQYPDEKLSQRIIIKNTHINYKNYIVQKEVKHSCSDEFGSSQGE